MSPGKLYLALSLTLLGFGVASVVALVLASRSDGGAAIEPEYYRKSMRFDEARAEDARSRALGWSLSASLLANESGQLVLDLDFRDASAAGIEGLRVDVEAFSVADSNAKHRAALTPVPEHLGRYRVTLGVGHCGLWELRSRAERGSDLHVLRSRLEVPCDKHLAGVQPS